MAVRETRLVALDDPNGNLPASRPEVEEITRRFPDGRVMVALGSQADRRFLEANVATATHLHLACHGCGAFFDDDDAAVVLAVGPVAASELAALDGRGIRLAVISACQSGTTEMAGPPDEALSVGRSCSRPALPARSRASAGERPRNRDPQDPAVRRAPGERTATARGDAPGAALGAGPRRSQCRGVPVPASGAGLGVRSARGASGRAGPELPAQSDRPLAHPHFWAAFVVLGAWHSRNGWTYGIRAGAAPAGGVVCVGPVRSLPWRSEALPRMLPRVRRVVLFRTTSST